MQPIHLLAAFLAGGVVALTFVHCMFMWHDRAERQRRVAVARRRFVRPALWPGLPWSAR